MKIKRRLAYWGVYVTPSERSVLMVITFDMSPSGMRQATITYIHSLRPAGYVARHQRRVFTA